MFVYSVVSRIWSVVITCAFRNKRITLVLHFIVGPGQSRSGNWIGGTGNTDGGNGGFGGGGGAHSGFSGGGGGYSGGARSNNGYGGGGGGKLLFKSVFS